MAKLHEELDTHRSGEALDIELVDRIIEPNIREGVCKMTDEMALPAETFARMVAFATR